MSFHILISVMVDDDMVSSRTYRDVNKVAIGGYIEQAWAEWPNATVVIINVTR